MPDSKRKSILILGGSFAGLTAAYELKRLAGEAHEITVVDKNEHFVFIPSLIWVPFGWRTIEQISFPLAPTLAAQGVRFLHATARWIDPARQTVTISQANGGERELFYDYLLVATGPHADFAMVEGLGPDGGYTVSICTAPHAIEAGRAWREFLREPGPVIVGATQEAACYGAAYEFVFNLEYALRKVGLRDRVPITYLTSEPFAGHFGIGGMKWAREMTEWFFRHTGIDWVLDAVVEKVSPGMVHLRQGRLHRAAAKNGRPEDLSGGSLPFRYAMIIPRFLGVPVVRDSGLGNARGFVVVDDYFRHLQHRNIYAAGVSVAVAPPEPCPSGCSVPKTGYISEVMAKYAARNILADIDGRPLVPKPATEIDAKCLMDAGNQGIIMLTDRIYVPSRHRKTELLIPGPWAHWAKVAFEKYALWKMRTGRVAWP
ncbi:MAG: FAD/NAD(P)-binding oxidoreductase [Bryobacterales bacterium]|nr:NAD(P)/FAD-dependent oxidoreductase [Bryobacteraceae bacterium]MDW8353466.1 FAD/NAD(P)-binding oxidoreductase [Bryobacterales bacterium]